MHVPSFWHGLNLWQRLSVEHDFPWYNFPLINRCKFTGLYFQIFWNKQLTTLQMHWGSVIELMHMTASFGHGFPLQWSICISHRSPSKPATQSHQYLDFSLLEVLWLVGWRWRQIPLTQGEERHGSETALISQRSPLNPFGQRHLKLLSVHF